MLCTTNAVLVADHSQSYLVRWVHVKGQHTISWSIQPHKKSINFGIFKHPGAGKAPTPKLPTSTFEPEHSPLVTPPVRLDHTQPDQLASRNASSTAIEKLKSIGLISIHWYGTCEANRVSTGTYDVPKGDGGMYALVFDNTFSKQISKSVTFVLLTYPSNSPPQANHHMHHIQASSTSTSLGLRDNQSPKVTSIRQESSDSIAPTSIPAPELSQQTCPNPTRRLTDSESSVGSNFFTGVLHKRRRKKHQGYARRFFSLDYTTSTLSYYHNRNTVALRGAVPLYLAAIGANADTRQISIDSGAEIWHLKAASRKDFEAWTNALELAKTSFSPTSPNSLARIDSRVGGRPLMTRINPDEEREWVKVEDLFNRVQESRDAARNLAKDTDPKYLSSQPTQASQLEIPPRSCTSSASGSPTDQGFSPGCFHETERKPSFWKRKQGGERTMPGMFRRSVSAQSTLTSSRSTLSSSSVASPSGLENQPLPSHTEETLHDHCMRLLRDLDSVVADFAALIAESKQRRTTVPASTMSRHSMESQGSQEFFDAEGVSSSQLLTIHHESEDERGGTDQDLVTDGDDTASESDDEESRRLERSPTTGQTEDLAFPSKPKSLIPLPLQTVRRRTTVPPSTVPPPSLIGFLRKNVGKDFSTISMPVSANEPLSLLQRVSEQLEYSSLLDAAASSSRTSPERLLYICAFAVSSFSSSRVKERAIRKPFNPMLGETFELVREDRGFRFIAEKVSHRPVRMACQAESENWTFTQAPMPTQKFWGKSAELITEGRARVILYSTGERFSWAPATSFLRNIIAGEKYVEPVGTMTVSNETTGEQAVVTFKSKGMFSGRSEDVTVHAFDPHGGQLSPVLVGKWTSSLAFHADPHLSMDDNTKVWTANELVPDAGKRYGFTTFAASLNEITRVESQKVAPTDSRFRPDQRHLEEGDLDKAEDIKAKLEEAQRRRRKIMEEIRREWVPRWFEKRRGKGGEREREGEGGGSGKGDRDGGERGGGSGFEEEEIWVAKTGKDSYWECRARGDWGGCEPIFEF